MTRATHDLLSRTRQAFLKRDDCAPIYITKDDWDGFEKRSDICRLQVQYKDLLSQCPEAKRILGKIKSIKDQLEMLLILERRSSRAPSPMSLNGPDVCLGAVHSKLSQTLQNTSRSPMKTSLIDHSSARNARSSGERTEKLKPVHKPRAAMSHDTTARSTHWESLRKCQKQGNDRVYIDGPDAWLLHSEQIHGGSQKIYTAARATGQEQLMMAHIVTGKKRAQEETIDPSTRTKKPRMISTELSRRQETPSEGTADEMSFDWDQRMSPDPHADEEFWVEAGCT
ncbi:hypothetical protein MKZ38_005117 [Zalerion maritima]|uniref:Uncharacterized protein n=1 Tax=Zalerion maritima TaxID=339359 RepID=A0AAD5RKD7_9PEZI|nr:hypothetical protein MKZ38_005117 [Zalerion maritima]